MISIIPFEEKYQPDFKRLNLEWLDKYQLTEQYDLDVLDQPVKNIIEPGGRIFLAMDGTKVVGTGGIARVGDGVYELVKMFVDPAYRGHGIGKMMLDHCVNEAKKLKAKKVSLFSNSQLVTALAMYEKFGFKHVEVTDSHLVTADVKMELSLSQ